MPVKPSILRMSGPWKSTSFKPTLNSYPDFDSFLSEVSEPEFSNYWIPVKAIEIGIAFGIEALDFDSDP